MAQQILYDTPLLFEQHHDLRNDARFVHTLLKNSSLGNMTRNLFIYHDDHDADTLESILDDVKFREAAKDALQLPPRFKSYLEAVSFERQHFCFASYALALTQNVRVVHIDGCSVLPLVSWMLSGSMDLEKESFLATPSAKAHHNDCYGPGRSDQEVESISTRRHGNFGLPNLEEVSIRCAGKDDGSASVEAIEAIFLHPMLKTLRLLGIDWRGAHAQLLKWNSYPSNLKTLELNDCFIDAVGLENILKRFPVLDTLIIELGGRYRTCPGDWEVDLHQFGQVLRKYGQRLSTLSLHCEGYESELMDLYSSIGSLQSLQALRHLAITKQRLLGAGGSDGTSKILKLEEALPPFLETLSFIDGPGWRGEQRNESIRKSRNKQIYQLITSGLFENLRQIKDERPIQDSKPFDMEIPGWRLSLTQERRRESLSHEYLLSNGSIFENGAPSGQECNIIILSRKAL